MRFVARGLRGALERRRRGTAESEQVPFPGALPKTEQVINSDLLTKAKPYLQIVAHQVNGTYENGWYDACAVMLRRFIETLIIEAYIAKGEEAGIKDKHGNFLGLQSLIEIAASSASLNISRVSKQILRKLKTVGDRSAHGRTFVMTSKGFDSLFDHLHLDMQTLIQDFLNEAASGDEP